MEQSRVKKYREYRESLGKKDDPVLKSDIENKNLPEEIINPRSSLAPRTTTSVPYEQIMKETNYFQNEESLVNELKKKRILNIVLLCIGIAILLAIIVVTGILIFRQGR
jgi:hypothetical protein